MSIARYYVGAAADGELPGVPTRDIEQDEFDSYPKYLQDWIDSSPLYRKTKPETAKTVRAEKEDT